MYLSFQLDTQKRWVVDLRKIHRVVNNEGIFAAPRQKPVVLGLFRLQSLLIPVFDLRLLMSGFAGEAISMPHLVIFYGRETLNAFPASVDESIQEECVMVENSLKVPFLDAYDLIYNDLRYHQLDFGAIEEHLNIP
jgi:hypothetical protein